jgi:hypothetical protein
LLIILPSIKKRLEPSDSHQTSGPTNRLTKLLS